MTASHSAVADLDVLEMSKKSSSKDSVEIRLKTSLKENGSWKKVALNLSKGKALDRAMLCRIANGKQRAPNSVLRVLGMKMRTIDVSPCTRCGEAHTTRRCTHRKTFEERVKIADEFFRKHAGKLLGWVAWAETFDISGRAEP